VGNGDDAITKALFAGSDVAAMKTYFVRTTGTVPSTVAEVIPGERFIREKRRPGR
jgi:hypothetical protein